MENIPYQFIDETIEVKFIKQPMLEKAPTCPDAFTWRGETYTIIQVLDEWTDFHRRGRMANNMQPAHASRAELHGSWGVGRFCFRVVVEGERIFEIYYDRSPGAAGERKGKWFLLGERRRV
jgi:hypothetical protein